MSHWFDVADLVDLPADDVSEVRAGDTPIAVFRVGDEVFATAHLCTHGNARLCDGFLEGYEIECPLHQGRFDVRNGQPLCAPLTEPVKHFPVQIKSGRVLVQLG